MAKGKQKESVSLDINIMYSIVVSLRWYGILTFVRWGRNHTSRLVLAICARKIDAENGAVLTTGNDQVLRHLCLLVK